MKSEERYISPNLKSPLPYSWIYGPRPTTYVQNPFLLQATEMIGMDLGCILGGWEMNSDGWESDLEPKVSLLQ